MPDPRWFECPVIIPYMGGKFELGRKLIPMMPPHKRYIEVFLGGGSIFFRKGKTELNILNDKHNDLVNMYLSVIQKYPEFIHYCESILKSRTLYDAFKEELKEDIKYRNMPNPERASKYFYIIKNAFNTNFQNPIAKESEWNDEMWNCLKTSRKKLENTMIENLDFRELFHKYPTREGDFWYLDPPYVIAGKRGDYYVHSLNMDDHNALFEMCKRIDSEGGKFMISYDDHDYVNDTYSNFRIKKIPIKYAGQMTGKDYKNELVITNYEPINTQEQLWNLQ
jgi:DNA adenine methylase